MAPTRNILFRLASFFLGLSVFAMAFANPAYREPGRAGSGMTDQLIVKLKSQKNFLVVPSTVTSRLSAKGGNALEHKRAMSDGSHVFKLSRRMSESEAQQVVERLKATDPDVESIEPDRILQPMLAPNDTYYAQQWQYFDAVGGINMPAAWNVTTGSPGVVVAVVDTGYRPHADLVGNILPGYDFIADSLVGNDGDGRDASALDPGDWVTAAEDTAPGGFFNGCGASNSSWHGTHVAGTIAAIGNNGAGVAGVGWQTKILPVRVLGKCGGYTSDILDGVRWAAGLPVPGAPGNPNPAKVISLSLGGSGTCGNAEQTAYNDVVAAGATVVVAAGNSNANAANFTPASCNNVIAVAANNQQGKRAYYSNYGAPVKISAPGGDALVDSGILSTLNAGTTTPGVDSYASYQGTSMATPHVSGVIALILAVNPSLKPAQVLSLIQSSARPFPAGSTCNTSICGAGIIDAAALVSVPPDAQAPSVPSGLLAMPINSSQIGLSWTAATDNVAVASYKVYRDGVLAGSSATTSYTDSGLVPLTSYGYAVAACDVMLNCSAQSALVTATTLAAPPEIFPSGGVMPGGWGTSAGANTGWGVAADFAYEGMLSVKSGPVVDLQKAQVEVTGDYSAGTVSFARKVSSEATYDFLRFYIDGVKKGEWSGEQTWAMVSYPVSAGTHTLRWSYEKDYSVSTGGDAAWVDEVTIPSAAQPDTQAPTVPAGLVATPVSSSRIDLSWTASTDNVGVTGYKVYRDGSLAATLGNVTGYSNTGLLAATTYSYTVEACDAAGNCSGQSAAVLAATLAADTASPSVPAGLVATPASASQIDLSWTASTDNVGVTGYKVYRDGGLAATLGNVTSHSDLGLVAATTYSYTVEACDAAGNCSGQSAAVLAVTLAPADSTAPSVPAGLAATPVSTSQIDLSWTASADNVGVTGYKVYRDGILAATLGNVTGYSNTGLIAATTYSYTVEACDAAGNCSGRSVAVPATTRALGVDLVPTAVSAAATSAVTGAGLAIADSVLNQGIGNMTAASIVVKYYLSADTNISATDILLGRRTIPAAALTAGAGSSSSTTFIIPTTAAAGAYYIGMIVDTANAQVESNEGNNKLASSSTVTVRRAGVDLVPVAVSTAAASVLTGTGLTITDTLQNQGTSNMTAISVVLRYYLSTDAAIAATDILLGSRTVARAAMTAGGSSTATTTFNVPGTVAAGNYYIGVIVDAVNSQLENNENNNKLASSSTIAVRRAGVDLVPTAVSTAAASVLTGTGLTITDTVQNQGTSNMTAVSVVLRYYLSTDATIAATDTLLGSRTVARASMGAGSGSTASTTFTVPETMTSGSYYIGVIVDATSAQAETNEANNKRAGSGTLAVIRQNVDLISTAVGTPFMQISAGATHTAAIQDDGSSWAWGANGAGQLGDGTAIQRPNPVRTGVDYMAVATGTNFTAALMGDGSLWAWGSNSYGQLGVDDTTNRSNPVQVGVAYAAVAAGGNHMVALKSDGSLWAWGANASGQLGNGDTSDQWSPAQVGADSDYAAVAAGGRHTVALKTDGSLWTWGANGSGQLGNGAITDQWNPVQIGTGYAAVTAGGNHTVALKADGSLWAWGRNASGQLGDGTTTDRRSPVQIGAGYLAVAAGADHTVALKNNGSLWAWGNNGSGRLGDGTTINRLRPVQIGTGYCDVAAGSAHTAALKNDGSAWAWGNNADGRLGDGTLVNRLRPVRNIPSLAAGDSVLISDTVKNAGSTAMTAPSVMVKYYLSADATITAADILLGSRTVPALAAGASDSSAIALSIPLSMPAGTYYIGEIVDAANAQAEANETNNARSGWKVLVHY